MEIFAMAAGQTSQKYSSGRQPQNASQGSSHMPGLRNVSHLHSRTQK